MKREGIVKQVIRITLTTMLLGASLFAQAQQSAVVNNNAVVPPLVKFSGTLNDATGKPLTGVVGVTFLLYKDDQGGAPLWLETQNVSADKNGHYSIMLGSTTSTGLPADIFVAGEARWLSVQPQGQEEKPRSLLLSVPYALKAGDAQTLGGLPASAFVLAAPPAVSAPSPSSADATSASAFSTSAPPPASSDVTTTGGTASAIPMFTTATDIQNSILTQTGTTAVNVGGTLSLPATGVATKTSGADSQPQTFVASAFNSTTSTALAQTFQWQATPVGNNTSNPSGLLNLLFGEGATTPANTGLSIASNGQIHFANSQVFPGVADLSASNFFTGTETMLGSDPSGVLQVTNSTTSGKGPAIVGTTDSSGAAGIKGVVAATTGTEAGVVGITSSTSGYGVQGVGPNVAVYGKASGPSGIGVDGHGALIGVKGVATASTGNAGVFEGNVAINSGGSLSLTGNAEQARASGGFVKALAYVDPGATGSGGIVRCFNSQTGSSKPPCGFKYVFLGLGDYIIDFGFNVSDRFAQVTAVYVGGGFDEYFVSATLCLGTCSFTTSSQIEVITFYPSGASVPNPPTVTNTPFFITVF